MAARTLRQLAERLNKLVANNDARGWGGRNDLPAAIELVSYTPTRKIRTRYFEVSYVSSAQTGISGRQFCGVINASEENEVFVDRGAK